MKSGVLLLSQRRISNLVAYCLAYEFEDAFATVTDAERIDVTEVASLEFSRRAYKLIRHASGSPRLARHFAPHPRGKVVLERDFELFFPIFSHSFELYSLATIPNWRKRCRKAACFITEVGSNALPKYLTELLSEFDQVFLGSRYGVEDMARITGRPCAYLPLAVDVPRFAPTSIDQPRPIDVCNIGRRSPVTHGALLERAERDRSFYYYDTVAASGADRKDRTFRVDNAREHRQLLANILKRSGFYIANRGYANRPKLAAASDEISSRFYEGAASGAVMVGEAPDSEEFRRQFDWPDAVIQVPFDCPDIGSILSELHHDLDRLPTVRRDSVREAALRHDWVHRIQVVFDALGLKPTEKMRERVRQLHEIASRA